MKAHGLRSAVFTSFVLSVALFVRLNSASADNPSATLNRAEVALLYQCDSGGWPKNYKRDVAITNSLRLALAAGRADRQSTIDNGATYTEIRLLSRAHKLKEDRRFKDAVIHGIRYLFQGQYKNGGWPQVFPNGSGYHRHITFNDDAMIGVMSLLRDIRDGHEDFDFLPVTFRGEAGKAIDKGVECILNCQIRKGGNPLVWCAQHDAKTLLPQKARSYELPSLSGSESVGITRFLMGIQEPSQRVVEAIEGAVSWFEESKLKGIRTERVPNASLERGFDTVVLRDSKAKPMWARFYDIETNKPIFCSRDGIPRATLKEISYERRNGYSWLGYAPEQLLSRDLPTWRKSLER